MTTLKHITLKIKEAKLTLQLENTFMHKEKEYKVIKLGNIQLINYKINKGLKEIYKKQKDKTYKKVSN